MFSFPNLEPVHCSMSGSVISRPAYKFHRRQVRRPDSPISLRIFQFVVIDTVNGFRVNHEAEIDVFYGILLLLL